MFQNSLLYSTLLQPDRLSSVLYPYTVRSKGPQGRVGLIERRMGSCRSNVNTMHGSREEGEKASLAKDELVGLLEAAASQNKELRKNAEDSEKQYQVQLEQQFWRMT